MPRERGCAAGVLVGRRFGAAQQPDRVAPHTGVSEIGAALSDCCADAVDCAHGEFEYRTLYLNGRLTDGAGRDHVSARRLHVKSTCSPLSICADSSFIYSFRRHVSLFRLRGFLRPLPVAAVSDLTPPIRPLADTKRLSAFR